MQKDLDQFVGRFTKALGGSLVSIVLYGSGATGDHDDEFSDINLMCVLREIGPEQLGAAEPLYRWWHGLGHASPLLLTARELETSTDCFAMEFHDVRESHRILHGDDVAAGIEIDRRFYRAQVERELRAKLLRLRTKAAPILSEKHALGKLLAESLSTFCALFRHALILSGTDAPKHKRAILEKCGATFGMDPKPFLETLDARENKTNMKALDAPRILGAYLRELSIVVERVDSIEK